MTTEILFQLVRFIYIDSDYIIPMPQILQFPSQHFNSFYHQNFHRFVGTIKSREQSLNLLAIVDSS